MLSKFFLCLSFVVYGIALNQAGNITPHSNARCSIRHLGIGLGGQNFRSNLTEKIVKFANPSPVRAPQRGMVYFSCIALCENTLKQNRSNAQPSRALRRLGGSLYWSPLNQPGNINPHSYAHCSIRHLGVGLGGQNFCFNLREVFFPISFGLMGTIYFGLILLRRMRGCTKTRVKHRRRLGSGYWTRRKIYWRRRKISRTAYIAEALQCSTNQRIYSLPESQERRKVMLTKPYSDIMKRNGHAVSRAQLDGECFEMKTNHAKRGRLEKSSKVLNSEYTLKGTDAIDCLDVVDGRTSTPVGLVRSSSRQRTDPIFSCVERQVSNNLTTNNRKSFRTFSLAKESCSKPARVSSKRVPFLVTQKRVKKQIGFRRRSGHMAGIRSESPSNEAVKRTKIMRICRKKKKKGE